MALIKGYRVGFCSYFVFAYIIERESRSSISLER